MDPLNPDALPLTEVSFFILLSLAREPRHGYAILKDIQTLSDGRLDLTAGTLYGALKRLGEYGWITRYEGQELDETGRPRKVYRLTDLGRDLLAAERQRLEGLVHAAERRAMGVI